MKMNELTIGIPVFNEERHIERAIRSAVGQCEILIVSDNASTDGTASICRKLADEFHNLRYVRKAENIGAIGNIIDVAGSVETPFMMILGAHDYIEAGYVDAVLPDILADERVECAMGGLTFVQAGGNQITNNALCEWHGGENSKPAERVWSFFTIGGSAVWATYGIFRTKTFCRLFTADLPRFGPDAIFIAKVLLSGKIKISKGAAYVARERQKEKSKAAYFERVTGISHTDKDVARLVNGYRVMQYEIIKSLYPNDGRIGKIFRRFISMSIFKPFKIEGRDIYYYLFYVPAVVANRLERMVRKFKV